MKNVLLLAAIIAANYSSAQITLDQTYTNTSSVTAIVTSTAGEKIVVRDTGSYQIRIYNPDYSPWKTINAPVVSGYKIVGHYNVSDNLFNSDANVEAVAIYNTVPPSNTYKALVIDESGGILADLGNAYYTTVHYINGVYKLFAVGLTSYSTQIYSLPGTMACGKCGTLGLAKPSIEDEDLLAIPNPNTGIFKVDGAGVLSLIDATGKTIYDDPQYNKAVINISKFPAGIYYVILNGEKTSFVKQ